MTAAYLIKRTGPEGLVLGETAQPQPGSLDQAKRSVVPISALTAWQGLFDLCNLQTDERVPIHGGSGGVGIASVPLAHWRGAQVMASTSTDNLDFVRDRGADEVIDYKRASFESLTRDGIRSERPE